MLPNPHTLRDGRQVILRHIEPDDKARLAAAHARLSEDTVRKRFLASKPRLSTRDLRYLTEVDGHDHIAIVAMAADDPDCIVAVARCIRAVDDPRVAEWAIVVGDELQGVGLGDVLSRALAREAAKAGIRSFTATTFGENQPIQRLMRSFTRELHGGWASGGVRELEGELALERLTAGVGAGHAAAA